MLSLVTLVFLTTLLHLSQAYTYYSEQHNDTVKHTSENDIEGVKLSIKECLLDDTKRKKIEEALNSKSEEDLMLLHRDMEKQASLKNTAAQINGVEYTNRESNTIEDEEDVRYRDGRIVNRDGAHRNQNGGVSGKRRVVVSSERYREGEDSWRPITLQVRCRNGVRSIGDVPLLDL